MSTGWRRLSTGDPWQLLSWGENLMVALDSGLYTYETIAGFRNLSAWIPERMAALEPWLVVDFGPGRGVFTYDGDWNSISSWTAEELEPVSLFR
jgi:hypothetical protein